MDSASDTAVKAVSELEKKPHKIIKKSMLHKNINMSGIISRHPKFNLIFIHIIFYKRFFNFFIK